MLFQWENKAVSVTNRFVWLKKWIMERRLYRTLLVEMDTSNRSLSRLFNKYLLEALQIPIRSKTKVHLLIDATYLPNGLCLVLYLDHDTRFVQLYRTTTQEKFREIYQDLKVLK